jgi:hypothetical protein
MTDLVAPGVVDIYIWLHDISKGYSLESLILLTWVVEVYTVLPVEGC